MRLLSILSIGALFALASCLGDTGPTFNEQLNKDIQKIDAYLAANNITAIKDISGVRVTIETMGTGYVPRLTDRVTVDYSGKYLNGGVFDSGTMPNKNITATSTEGGLIPGFQIGITMIPAGSSATIYVPSGYGYGQQAYGSIPGNSNLVFTVTLKSITVTNTELTKLASDTVSIDKYVLDSAITNVVKDTSGLRYRITQLGTGAQPSLYNKLKISYTGYLFSNNARGAKFYQGSNEPNDQTDSRAVNFIRGFQIGLQKLPKGSKARFYIPSGMGFGNQSIPGGQVPIPANSILIYDVELIDVMNP
jgi:FKBP-type peptidyl-prolyl cis-trans isomerase